VPSAYLGDLFGRKYLMVWGSLIMGIGFTLLLNTKTFIGLCFYEGVLAIGASFISGADLSILYDSISETREAKLKALGEFQSFQLLGEALAAVCCSLLMIYGFKDVLQAQFIIGWIPLIIAISIKEPPFEKMDKKMHKHNISEVLSHVFKNDKFLQLIFINMVLWSVSTFCAIWLIQKYWFESNVGLTNLGYFWAVCNLCAAIVGQYAARIEKKNWK
jgi:MFS family permease